MRIDKNIRNRTLKHLITNLTILENTQRKIRYGMDPY